jgi:hypothetical protein
MGDKMTYIFITFIITTFLSNCVRNNVFNFVIDVFYVVAVTQGQQQEPECAHKLSDKYSTSKVMHGGLKCHIFISYPFSSLSESINILFYYCNLVYIHIFHSSYTSCSQS